MGEDNPVDQRLESPKFSCAARETGDMNSAVALRTTDRAISWPLTSWESISREDELETKQTLEIQGSCPKQDKFERGYSTHPNPIRP
jgi:hypothetical protein